MSEIQIQKIDWVEFVTYKDYLRLQEENQKLKEREEELRIYITELDKNIGRCENAISDLEDELDVKTRENKWLKKETEETIQDLQEENKKLKFDIEAWKKLKAIWEEENQKLKEDLEKFSEAYKKYRDYEKEELAESCYDLARENQKLKEKIAEYENLPF